MVYNIYAYVASKIKLNIFVSVWYHVCSVKPTDYVSFPGTTYTLTKNMKARTMRESMYICYAQTKIPQSDQ